MLSSKYIVRYAVIIIFIRLTAVPSSSQSTSAAGTLACPATIAVVESAKPPNGWGASGGQVERPFERVSIFNGKQGGQEYELAPDDEKKSNGKIVQSWLLKDYRSMNLFMRCRYHDTPAVLSIDLPLKLETCTFTFQLDSKGEFIGKSTLICR